VAHLIDHGVDLDKAVDAVVGGGKAGPRGGLALHHVAQGLAQHRQEVLVPAHGVGCVGVRWFGRWVDMQSGAGRGRRVVVASAT
jgi:metal-dependent hydrolase (beta-lactamase superfamily II)